MNNGTDRTTGDHLVDEHPVDLLKLIGRRGRKITGLYKGRFVLVPVDGQAQITDDFSTLIRYDKPLHIEFERSPLSQGRFVLEPVDDQAPK